jgi:hypothetical protein
MAYTQSVNRFADRVLDGVRQVNGTAVNVASTVSHRIGEILPDEVPGASALRSLPRPEELVKTYWDFIERLVKTQRTYALDLAKAFEPITGKIWKPAVRSKAAA